MRKFLRLCAYNIIPGVEIKQNNIVPLLSTTSTTSLSPQYVVDNSVCVHTRTRTQHSHTALSRTCMYVDPPFPSCFTSNMDDERPISRTPAALGDCAIATAVMLMRDSDRFTM